MNLPKINFHIHSTYSDGKGTIRQIVEKSLKLGLHYIAITDHFSNSWKANVIPTLNSEKKIESYLNEISEWQEYLSDKRERLLLFKGIEIDLGSSINYINKYINPEQFDIILFEYLESPESIAFAKNIIMQWKKLRLQNKSFPLLGLAHFDPMPFFQGGLNNLIKFLQDYNIYYEFNSRYSEYYSRKYESFFQKLFEYNIPVTIGCDSHSLKELNDIEEPFEMIIYYNLEKNFKSFFNLIEHY